MRLTLSVGLSLVLSLAGATRAVSQRMIPVEEPPPPAPVTAAPPEVRPKFWRGLTPEQAPLRARFERRRATGRVLTAIALVNAFLCTVGMVLFAIDQSDSPLLGFPGMVTAAAAGGVGTILLAVGVPLWSSGQRNLDRLALTRARAPAADDRLRVLTRVSPDGGSLLVAWHF